MKPTEDADKPTPTLSQKAARGGLWVFLLRATNFLIGYVKVFIIARILAPSDFGLVGVALLLIATLETFSQTGFQYALIQKPKETEKYLNAVWTVSILRGLVLAGILVVIAPWAAQFFNAPASVHVIQVVALTVLLKAFMNVGVVYFVKDIQFNKQFALQMSMNAADFIVAVAVVLIFKTYWALVLGLVAGRMVGVIASYILHPYRPKLDFNFNKIRGLWRYGRWITGATIVIFLATQGDDFFVVKMLGVAALGLYRMAFRIGNLPSSEFTGIVGKVAFPLYSKLLDNKEKLKEAYLRTIVFSTFFSIPLTGAIVVLAPLFTRVILGEKWLGIILPLQILAVSGMFRSIAGTGGSLFNAIGKPYLDFIMNSVRLAVIVAAIYPLTVWMDIAGASLAVLLGIIGACVVWLIASIREVGVRGWKYLATISTPLIGAVPMCAAMYAALQLMQIMQSRVGVLLISSVVGIAVYAGVMYAVEKFTGYSGYEQIKLILKNLRKTRSK